MTAKNLKLQVPGEIEEQIDEAVDQVEPTLDSLADMVDELKRRISDLESPSRPVAQRQASLPAAADIDSASIKAPVLTADGWVAPDNYGAPGGPR